MKRVLVIHGPNLNLLGEREPGIYGRESLRALNRRLRQQAERLSCQLVFFQSNSEGEIIDFLHDHRLEADGIIINPGGLTHTSVALRDALAALRLPAVEVHISDISQREDFRKFSYVADVCVETISGAGTEGYLLALEKLVKLLEAKRQRPTSP